MLPGKYMLVNDDDKSLNSCVNIFVGESAKLIVNAYMYVINKSKPMFCVFGVSVNSGVGCISSVRSLAVKFESNARMKLNSLGRVNAVLNAVCICC